MRVHKCEYEESWVKLDVDSCVQACLCERACDHECVCWCDMNVCVSVGCDVGGNAC